MTNAQPNPLESPLVASARQSDAICDRFEATWKEALRGGQRPALAVFCAEAAGDKELLRELIALDVHYRRASGEHPRAEEYAGYAVPIDAKWFPAQPPPASNENARSLVPLERFVRQLTDSGIIAAETLDDFLPPKTTIASAVDLARELVRHKKLTRFQAEEVYRGHAGSLVLGNYLLLEKIGAGGMGQVFKAQHRRMDRVVALKLLPPNVTRNREAVARFEREVQAAARLSHPNIVAAFDADCANGVHFLVMEFVEGSDLSVLVKKNGPLSLDRALHYILQTARGLEAAHAAGIVHRDIKPANLLLDRKGTVKILDLGLARMRAEADRPQAELTSTGAILGTVDYMAPEQALSTRHADARADVYSLGCTLYYLLTGNALYGGESVMAKLVAHRELPVPALRAVRPDVPEPVEAVFSGMVAKKTEARYQSMSDVIAALEKCGTRTERLIDTQLTFGSDTDPGLTNFLKDISLAPRKPISTKKSSFDKAWIRKKWLLVGGSFVGVLALVAGLVIRLSTKEGTLIVEVNEPGAEVQVLSTEDTVEIMRKGEQGSIRIAVDPGKHRLKIVKQGFEFFTQDFEMESRGQATIVATLVPSETKVPPVWGKSPSALAMTDPAFQQWVKEVAALPAEDQIKAVAQKLRDSNPAFDGNVKHQIEKGVVTELQFFTDHVRDISAVRALTGLKKLDCSGSGSGKGNLANLLPLQGMRLKFFFCNHTAVSDLSTLAGMPLTTVGFTGTQVTDLSPLQGMQLEYLGFEATNVEDLSPLRGMSLNYLQCAATQVSDLSPLAGMPLNGLSCEGTRISDLSPLKGMPMVHLACRGTPVVDLSPIKDLPLKVLSCDFKADRAELLHSIKTLESINGKPVADFWKEVQARQAALEAWAKEVSALPAEGQVREVARKLQELNSGFDGTVTPKIENGVVIEFQVFTDDVSDIFPVRALAGLKRLFCGGSQSGQGKLSDLAPLEGMQLTYLSCESTRVSDLRPLRGMPLTGLVCFGTQVSDLSPLAELKELNYLNCVDTQVSDLSPLEGMPFNTLHFGQTQVSDLSPLAGMPLLNFVTCYDTPVTDLSPLQGKSLSNLNCRGTHVSDLTPLKGMPIEVLICDQTQIEDLSPIANLPLKALFCDYRADRAELLHSIKTLETINGKPVAEFWKETDTP